MIPDLFWANLISSGKILFCQLLSLVSIFLLLFLLTRHFGHRRRSRGFFPSNTVIQFSVAPTDLQVRCIYLYQPSDNVINALVSVPVVAHSLFWCGLVSKGLDTAADALSLSRASIPPLALDFPLATSAIASHHHPQVHWQGHTSN